MALWSRDLALNAYWVRLIDSFYVFVAWKVGGGEEECDIRIQISLYMVIVEELFLCCLWFIECSMCLFAIKDV